VAQGTGFNVRHPGATTRGCGFTDVRGFIFNVATGSIDEIEPPK